MKRWKVHQRALCILNPVCVTIRGFVWAAIITKQRKCRFTFRYTISLKPSKKVRIGPLVIARPDRDLPVKPHWCWLGSVGKVTTWEIVKLNNSSVKLCENGSVSMQHSSFITHAEYCLDCAELCDVSSRITVTASVSRRVQDTARRTQWPH